MKTRPAFCNKLEEKLKLTQNKLSFRKKKRKTNRRGKEPTIVYIVK